GYMARGEVCFLRGRWRSERGNRQNRGQIRLDGEARWLTVPVAQRSQKERIIDKLVDNQDPRPWGTTQFSTLRHAYREAAHFKIYASSLHSILDAHWERLVDLNRATLEFMREAFEIRTPLARSSELGVEGARSDLILNLCRAVGADGLLAGFGGSRQYLDTEAFARAGVRVQWHEFTHPEYPQCGAQPFIPGLAALDLLFNCGPASRALLFKEPAARELRAAA